jgi:hypothetical protein
MGIRWVPIGCHGKKIQKNKTRNASNLKRETLTDMGILAIRNAYSLLTMHYVI